MFINQIVTSEGIGVAGVNVTNRSISNINIFSPCHAGLKLGSDGVLSTINASGGFNAISGEWLITGSAAGFFVKRTIISGTLDTDPGTGFLQLNANRTYEVVRSVEGTSETVLFLEFSSDASGVPLVATATYTITAEQGLSV